MARYVELRRHTDSDGDVLTAEGVRTAVEIGRRLTGPYVLLVSSGAQRATQTLACFACALTEVVSGGVIVEPGFRSDVEDRWRAAYQSAGSGELSALGRQTRSSCARIPSVWRAGCAGSSIACPTRVARSRLGTAPPTRRPVRPYRRARGADLQGSGSARRSRRRPCPRRAASLSGRRRPRGVRPACSRRSRRGTARRLPPPWARRRARSPSASCERISSASETS